MNNKNVETKEYTFVYENKKRRVFNLTTYQREKFCQNKNGYPICDIRLPCHGCYFSDGSCELDSQCTLGEYKIVDILLVSDKEETKPVKLEEGKLPEIKPTLEPIKMDKNGFTLKFSDLEIGTTYLMKRNDKVEFSAYLARDTGLFYLRPLGNMLSKQAAPSIYDRFKVMPSRSEHYIVCSDEQFKAIETYLNACGV